MENLIDALALLRGEKNNDAVSDKLRPCFCQGNTHVLHPIAPMCTTCGLLICSIVSPSPLLGSDAACPSCGESMLDEQSRALLVARLDAQVAKMMHEQEEHVARVKQERQLARQGRKTERELFPQLSNQAPPASSSAAADYSYFSERRRQIDVAMGRRIDDPDSAERRVRVLRIGAKPKSPGTSSSTKKRAKSKKSADGAKSLTRSGGNARLSSPVGQGRIDDEGRDTAIDEQPDEESYAAGMLDLTAVNFDDADDPLAPVSDPHDIGYLRRWLPTQTIEANKKSLANESARKPSNQRWRMRDDSELRYLLPSERISRTLSHTLNENSEQGEVQSSLAYAAARLVPGSSQAVNAKG